MLTLKASESVVSSMCVHWRKKMSSWDTGEIRIKDGKAMQEKKMGRERRKIIQRGRVYSIQDGDENGKQEVDPV